MALAELLTALEAEAAAEAARLDAEALEQGRLIVEAARAEARVIAERAASADEDELGRVATQRRAAARLAAARALRETREESFRALLAEVGERLASCRETAEYPAVLRAAIRESIAALPGATALRVDPRDETLAAELLDALGAQLPVEATLQTAGGVELAGSEGRSLRNTLEERLSNAEPALRILFGRLLAGGATPAGPAAVAP